MASTMIPGGTALGVGFNLFGAPDMGSSLRRLFELGDVKGQYQVGAENYDIPSNAALAGC
jgi:hypothetical protein